MQTKCLSTLQKSEMLADYCAYTFGNPLPDHLIPVCSTIYRSV